jgi:hypothetical protein
VSEQNEFVELGKRKTEAIVYFDTQAIRNAGGENSRKAFNAARILEDAVAYRKGGRKDR